MLSANLEQTLHRALAAANERRHEYATLEHLLLALTEDSDSVAVLRACDVDLDRLRSDLFDYIDNELSNLISAQFGDAKPTAGFQRVIQRAAIHVQSSGRMSANKSPSTIISSPRTPTTSLLRVYSTRRCLERSPARTGTKTWSSFSV